MHIKTNVPSTIPIALLYFLTKNSIKKLIVGIIIGIKTPIKASIGLFLARKPHIIFARSADPIVKTKDQIVFLLLRKHEIAHVTIKLIVVETQLILANLHEVPQKKILHFDGVSSMLLIILLLL